MMNTETRAALVREAAKLTPADVRDSAEILDNITSVTIDSVTDFYAEAIFEVALDDGLIDRDEATYDFISAVVFARLVWLSDTNLVTFD